MIGLTKSKNAIVVHTQHPERLWPYIPQEICVQRPGLVAIPYTMDAVQILKNLGLDMEEFHWLDHKYTFPKVELKYEMYPHAKTTAKRMVDMKRGFNLNDPRTAKTSSAIAFGDSLQQAGKVSGVLIITPLTTIESVWTPAFRGMVPHKSVGVLWHKSKVGQARADYIEDELRQRKHFYLINPAGVKGEKILPLLIRAKKAGIFNCCVIDESTEFANPTTAQWKAAFTVTNDLPYFSMMTGTQGNPEQAYGQAKLMDISSVPSRKDVWRDQTMVQIAPYKWVPRKDAEERILKVMQPAVRFKKRDVWPDMPKEMIIPHKVPLSKKQQLMIDALRREKGAIVNGHEILPANAGVLAGKVLQIVSGTMILDSETGESLRLPIKERLDALLQLKKESPGKMIVYVNNRETVLYLQDLLTEKKVSSEVVYGEVAAHRRPEIFRRFMDDEDPEVIVVHPKTVSYGVELGAADQIVFWGPPTISPHLYQQVKDRLFSSHQKSEQPVIYQMYSTYAEKLMFNNLDDGVEWQTGVSDMFRDLE